MFAWTVLVLFSLGFFFLCRAAGGALAIPASSSLCRAIASSPPASNFPTVYLTHSHAHREKKPPPKVLAKLSFFHGGRDSLRGVTLAVPFPPCRLLFSRVRGKLLLVERLRFFSPVAGKGCWDWGGKGGRLGSVSHADGLKPLDVRSCGVCRSAHVRMLSANRTCVKGSGGRTPLEIWPGGRSLLEPTWVFFVCKCHAVILGLHRPTGSSSTSKLGVFDFA